MVYVENGVSGAAIEVAHVATDDCATQDELGFLSDKDLCLLHADIP